ncbi:MAG: hypothetical protein Devi2KO_39830 [Devosia indica]
MLGKKEKKIKGVEKKKKKKSEKMGRKGGSSVLQHHTLPVPSYFSPFFCAFYFPQFFLLFTKDRLGQKGKKVTLSICSFSGFRGVNNLFFCAGKKGNARGKEERKEKKKKREAS